MGQLNENDAVQFDDAYSKSYRNIINSYLGSTVQKRYLACQKYYLEATNHVTIKDVGHWTSSEINLEVIKFFLHQIKVNKTEK